MELGAGLCGIIAPVSTANNSGLFLKLPSTDELIREPRIRLLIEREGHTPVADSIRVVLARLRQEIADGELDEKSLDLALALDGLSAAVERQLRDSLSYRLVPLINATGVILHTNLGRAPLAADALEHVRSAANAYCNLEFDLATGERGKRDIHVDRLFQKLLCEEPIRTSDHGSSGDRGAGARSNAISTIVVNNNSAGVLLALNTLADDGEVIVSRGELIEIGGSFRIPDVMQKSHASAARSGHHQPHAYCRL